MQPLQNSVLLGMVRRLRRARSSSILVGHVGWGQYCDVAGGKRGKSRERLHADGCAWCPQHRRLQIRRPPHRLRFGRSSTGHDRGLRIWRPPHRLGFGRCATGQDRGLRIWRPTRNGRDRGWSAAAILDDGRRSSRAPSPVEVVVRGRRGPVGRAEPTYCSPQSRNPIVTVVSWFGVLGFSISKQKSPIVKVVSSSGLRVQGFKSNRHGRFLV